jgi:hypothetical protein
MRLLASYGLAFSTSNKLHSLHLIRCLAIVAAAAADDLVLLAAPSS